ncbi:MAG: amidase, partial [Dehalococcoidia bacterium]
MSSQGGGISALTVAELAKHIAAKTVSPVDVTEAYLQRIEATEEDLNAFITLTADQALAKAKQAEIEIGKGGYRGPLHGIPFATKDLFWTKGVRTTSGSESALEFVPEEDATAVRRLQDAGAISIGKTNMAEWAFDATGRNEFFGWAYNPWDKERMPGGSSSGSAVAVAAGGAPLAIGTDTAGSIRIPAALCGLSGLKPTYGLVSRHGVTPLSLSLDHVGPLAHTVEDVALAMDALAGRDASDPYSKESQSAIFTESLTAGIQGLRIGLPYGLAPHMADPDVRDAFVKALAILEELGARVEEVALPELELAPPAASVITRVEAA